MITKKTVLVLGAGASKPYGLPLGSELTELLRSWAFQDPGPNAKRLFAECGCSEEQRMEFAVAFNRSGLPSVDTFLEQNPEMGGVGKLSIAYQLGIMENDAESRWCGIPDNWYMYLWNRMQAGTNRAHTELLLDNSLRIITFNYDRSLESFLFDAIKHTYQIESYAAQKLLDGLWIKHVYGLLGNYHFLGVAGGGRGYQTITDATELKFAARGIRTIPEARNDEPLFKSLEECFHWADEAAFMGFSFDPVNVERLGIASAIDELVSRKLRVIACLYQMTNREIERAKRLIGSGRDMYWCPIPDKTNLSFLRETDLLE